jgi:hypothetical protein
VILTKAAIDGADDGETAADDHHIFPCLTPPGFARPPDGLNLLVVECLTGDIYRVMMQILDRSVKPLSIDRLENKRITDGICLFVHTAALEDENVPLGLAKKWDQANN